MLMHFDITTLDPTAARPRALVVEANPLTRDIHARILTQCGLDVEMAANGLESIRAVMRSQAIREPFDLIVMDIAMPVVDGWVASSTVRRNGYAGRLVVISGNSDLDTPARCASCGVDYFLLKPTTANVLMATVRACVHIPSPRLRRTHFEPATIPSRQLCQY